MRLIRFVGNLLRRLVITVSGIVVVAVGVVLLVLPGPGFLVIVLGLLILSTEYAWARRRLAAAQLRAQQMAARVAANRVATALTVLFALCVIACGGLLIASRTSSPSRIATGSSVSFAGVTILATVIFSLRERSRAQVGRR